MIVQDTDKSLAGKRLAELNEEEREQYYQFVCRAFGLPAELRLLEYTTMKNEDGQNQLVLYAKKQATDMLRDAHGIQVNKLTTEFSGDYIVCTAYGANKSGRQDIAVGSACIRGLTGKQAGYQPMIAQTRATRRLTLQLAGCGFLDESEVTELIEPPAKPVVAVESAAIPKANDSPGIPVNVTVNLPKTVSLEPEVTKKRKRRTKAEIEAEKFNDLPVASTPEAQADEQPKAAAPIAATQPEPIAAKADAESLLSSVVKESAPLIVDRPNAEQMKAYRGRLSKYNNDTLPEAGMMPSEGMGINAKVRKFAQKMFAGADLNNLTVAQWDALLGYMDNYIEKHDARHLVLVIEEKIKD